MRAWRLAGCAAVALAASAIAYAEKPAAPTIGGTWKFKTEPLPSNGCIISGDMTIAKTATPNLWSCEFVSREDCGTKDHPRFQKVAQSCRAVSVGKAVEITSAVKAIVDAGPPEERDAMMTPGRYRADDFSVMLAPSGDEMTGGFHSLQKAGVRFWRIRDLTS